VEEEDVSVIEGWTRIYWRWKRITVSYIHILAKSFK
jgi:hypothetical protein